MRRWAVMERAEVERLISQYWIRDLGDGRIQASIQKEDPMAAVIREAKPEILRFFAEREAQRQRELEIEQRRSATIERIPGYVELRNAIRAESDYSEEFAMAIERGDGFVPIPPEGPGSKEIAARYPAAAFAYKVDNERFCANSEITAIAIEAYAALGDGKDWVEVKAK